MVVGAVAATRTKGAATSRRASWLAIYFKEIAVKDFVAAGESRAVVLFAKRLDNPRGLAGSRRHLFAGMLFVTPRRFAHTGPRRKGVAVAQPQTLAGRGRLT